MSGCEFRRKRLLMCCSSKSWVASRIGSSLVSRRIMRTPSGKVSDDVPCRKRFLGTLNGRIQLTRAGSKAMKTRQQWIFRQQAILTGESPTPNNNTSIRSSALRESRHAAGGIGIGRSPANGSAETYCLLALIEKIEAVSVVGYHSYAPRHSKRVENRNSYYPYNIKTKPEILNH